MFVPTIKYKRVDTVKEKSTPITNNISSQSTIIKKSPESSIITSKDSITVVIKEENQQLSTTKAETDKVKYIKEKEMASTKKINTDILENKEVKKEIEKQTSKTETDTDIPQEEKQTSIKEINCDVLKEEVEKIDNEIKENTITFEESTSEPSIIIDPKDNEQLLITLSDGTQYTTDRYCPHAGADLSYLGQVDEDEYPPEIGPILVCTLHYWEYALKRGGRGANGVATINACPVKNQNDQTLPCPAKKELDW
ncbi:hypothetical protein BJ944DRAFT_258195 [Cunninghamella echinulata]|nr:hypothetical protein BJ944DRAFT_258195 [Cunninghamella echinulata]